MTRATKFPARESEGTAGPSRSISKGAPVTEAAGFDGRDGGRWNEHSTAQEA